MAADKDHPGLKQLEDQFNDGTMGRRDFLRYATLLGVSATAAYGMLGLTVPRSVSAANMPEGGTIRISQPVLSINDPHTYSWLAASNCGRGTHEYLTRTDQDNITRPYLAERWEASDDLKTWTFRLRKVKWHDGRDFTADDAIWNILRCLDENIWIFGGRSHEGLYAQTTMTLVRRTTTAAPGWALGFGMPTRLRKSTTIRCG